MKTIIRNFSHTFRRFLTASLLNIIGLSIAFASFFVIMTQVDYDYNFNKGYKDYDKILRNKIARFMEETKTRKSIQLTFISSYGLLRNMYSGIAQNEVVLNDLF